MSDSNPRRRLQLMPEVLPAPNSSHDSSGSGPRERTLARMRTLLAAAATTAAIGCSRRDPVPQIGPDPKTMPAKKKDDDPTPVVDAAVAVPVPDPGYGVVDPLPPPPQCPGLAASVVTTLASKSTPKGTAIEIVLKKPTFKASGWDKTAKPTVYGGTLESHAFVGDDLVVRVVPDAKSAGFYVYAQASCPTGTERVYAQVDTSKSPPTIHLADVSY